MHRCEPGLVNGFSQACVPSTGPSGVTVVCKLREGKGKRQGSVAREAGPCYGLSDPRARLTATDRLRQSLFVQSRCIPVRFPYLWDVK